MGKRGCIHVVDDDSIDLEVVLAHFESHGLVARGFGSAEEFLERYRGGPGCLVLELMLPGMNGEELQLELRRRARALPLVYHSASADLATAVRCVRRGAVDFIQKPARPEVLLRAARHALALDEGTRRDLAESHKAARRIARLTPREREVLEWVATGASTKEIAARLGISARTVDVHRSRVTHKMRARSLGDLIRSWMLVDSKAGKLAAEAIWHTPAP